MAKSKAATTPSARAKKKNGRSSISNTANNDDDAAAAAAVETAAAATAVAAPAPAKNSNKKHKLINERDSRGSIGKEAAAAVREESGDRAPQPQPQPHGVSDRDDVRGEGGVDDGNGDHYYSIKIPRRTILFPVPETWWMVDLYARPIPTQGATPLVRRCMRELGWAEAKARSTLQAYRQFLSVKVAKKDWNAELLSPSVAVDQMWHQHVLDNANYAHDCLLFCGNFIKHDPDGGLDVEARKKRLEATRQALLEGYGEGEDDGEKAGELDRSATGPWKEVFGGAVESGEEASTARSASPVVVAAPASDDGDRGSTLIIRLRDQALATTRFRVQRTAPMGNVFAAYARLKGVNVGSCRFLLDGDVIRAHQTPISLELEDEDEIDTILEQAGC
jgi:Ubiquitin-2 like Rad60 SUMO-like